MLHCKMWLDHSKPREDTESTKSSSNCVLGHLGGKGVNYLAQGGTAVLVDNRNNGTFISIVELARTTGRYFPLDGACFFIELKDP